MAGADVKTSLERLLTLLLQERETAKALDMTGLQEVVAAKEELLASLSLQPEDIAGHEDLLRQIDHENRRNAFLLWTRFELGPRHDGLLRSDAHAPGLWWRRQIPDVVSGRPAAVRKGVDRWVD